MSMISIVCMVVVCCAVVGRAAPAHEGAPLSMALSEVMPHAVCPLRVHIDEEPHRVPRRIKMLKCAHEPSPVCRQQGMQHACCGRRHLDYHTQCVEVTDTVLVRYTDQGDDDKLHPISVSVGCSCMIRDLKKAREDH